MFETSSAMLEIFGGAPTPQQPSQQNASQQEKESASLNAALASTAVYEAAVRQPVAPIENGVSRPEPDVFRQEPTVSQQVTLDVDREQSHQAQSASVTFQQVPPTPPTVSTSERPQFGRTNALTREGISLSEWEPVTSQTTATVSSFQVCSNLAFI
jgi:hypothetical protein